VTGFSERGDLWLNWNTVRGLRWGVVFW
jgi:hypothetical protein